MVYGSGLGFAKAEHRSVSVEVTVAQRQHGQGDDSGWVATLGYWQPCKGVATDVSERGVGILLERGQE